MNVGDNFKFSTVLRVHSSCCFSAFKPSVPHTSFTLQPARESPPIQHPRPLPSLSFLSMKSYPSLVLSSPDVIRLCRVKILKRESSFHNHYKHLEFLKQYSRYLHGKRCLFSLLQFNSCNPTGMGAGLEVREKAVVCHVVLRSIFKLSLAGKIKS